MSFELLKGVRNLVAYGGVKKGDEVLIFVDRPNDDPLLIKAMEIVIEEIGATPVVVKAKEWPMKYGVPPNILNHALLGANVIIGQTESLNPKSDYMQTALKERGAKYVINQILRADLMASEYATYPNELLFAIGVEVYKRVIQGKRLRVTSPKGTDMSMGIHPRRIGGFNPRRMDLKNYCLKRWGDKEPYPQACFGIHPEDPANGVAYIDLIHPGLYPPVMFPQEPLKITVENHWATCIEGGQSEWLKEILKTKGDEYATWLGECMWGIHPKAEPFGWPTEASDVWRLPLHSRPDLLHFALGRAIGGGPWSKIHADFYLRNPTVYIDGEKLIDNGHLLVLEDPEIRKIASKYGEPDQILAVKPLPAGMFH